MQLKLQENVTIYVGQAEKLFANVNRFPCSNTTTRGSALHCYYGHTTEQNTQPHLQSLPSSAGRHFLHCTFTCFSVLWTNVCPWIHTH